jgi:hypothetical protein
MEPLEAVISVGISRSYKRELIGEFNSRVAKTTDTERERLFIGKNIH